MDDSCAVCAETLEWVAYGACGHRDVCSTCVARLRFICDDRRCCICKTESNVVFITKALGDYTRMINDFSVLPTEVREGRVGAYWYHVDTQAFFDDVDHYKMIKAMCRLSCSVCDKMEEQPNDGSKRRARFRNIEQLKGHLFHQHRLLMCSLCLEGRKIFICEQKLYTRAQLNQHISTGDSEVDGSESERGGFMGHPMCEFCRTPFYGDNELYTHMSSEHYTCHICQREHPGQYEYYKNYDDLEIHFRREHFLCEDEACLAKKFIVFPSESEMKRHNAIEHGGRMSRSQRNAALQIPTSFRYSRINEQDRRRGRGQTFRRDSSDNQLSTSSQARFETANVDDAFHDPSFSSTGQVGSHGDAGDIDPIIQPFESLATTDSEPSSRYLQALGHNSRNVPLEESIFPPLPLAPSSSQKPIHDSKGLPNNTMAARLRHQNNRNVSAFSVPQARQPTSHGPLLPSSSLNQLRPTTTISSVLSHGSGKPGTGNGLAPSTYESSTLAQTQPEKVNGIISAGSSRSTGNSSWISQSASAPNLVQSRSLESANSDFPAVSATQIRKSPAISKASLNAEDVQTANGILVEKIRSAVQYDQEKFTTIRDLSLQYRQGSIDAVTYLEYVQRFGLSHLVPDLARLCPDAQKQKELVDTYNAGLQNNGPQENGWGHVTVHLKDSNGLKKKGKEKRVDTVESNSKNAVADNIINSVRKLQASYKPSEEEEVLSKDGYRTSKGKSKLMVEEVSSANQPSVKLSQYVSPSSESSGFNQKGEGGGGSKQRKKTPKFLRARLGDGSLLDLKTSDPDPDPGTNDGKIDAGVPGRGVWRNGGGNKLFP